MSLIGKVYTAKDMRAAAKCLFACEVDLEHDNRDIARMLRQAADMLDRADGEAAEKREIETLRALVEGLIKASSVDCASCGYDCGQRRENCITKKAIVYLEGHS